MHVEKIIIDINNSIHLILIEILEWKIVVKKLAEFRLQKMEEIKFYHTHIKYRTKITKQNKGNKVIYKRTTGGCMMDNLIYKVTLRYLFDPFNTLMPH